MTEINNQPIAPIAPVTDNYFGTDVVDNYRYMEDFNDPAVQQWVKAQADYTIDTLSQLPGRKAFFDRIKELDDSVPAKVSGVLRLANGKIFYRKIDIHSDTSKLYMRSSLDSAEILLVDPDRFGLENGHKYAMNDFKLSSDGKYVIYLICLNQVRFETTPNGVNNTPEFGSCETEAGFQALYEMDSFLHVRDGVDYPAMLITHGITDPRVEPWQSAKFAARVQAASASGKPVLLRIDYEAGHGIGSTKTQIIQERADIFAFMMWQFGLENYQRGM